MTSENAQIETKPAEMAASTPWVFRFMPSLTDVAFLAPIGFLFGKMEGAKTLLGDGDTGWHIRAGEWMIANGRVPEKDLFSFTKPDAPWYAWEWLADVILAALHLRFGLAGVVFLGALLIALSSVLLFRLCRKQVQNDLLAIGVTVAALGASSIHWLARPHLFSFVFVLLTLHLLLWAEGNRNRLWWLVPMIALWTNLHGAFFVGLILVGGVGFGKALECLIAPEGGIRQAWAAGRTYLAVVAAGAAASLLNPYGWELHKHIAVYLTERFHYENIIEFQSLSFHHVTARYFEFLILASVTAVVMQIGRRRFADAVLVLGWLHLALMASRNIPIFAFVAAPVVARFLDELVAALRNAPVAGWLQNAATAVAETGAAFSKTDRIGRLHLVSGAGFALVLLLVLGAPADSKAFRAEFDTDRYPAKALPLLEARRVFTDDEWGDYLIYKLYPKTRVYVDGRSDFYGDAFSQANVEMLQAKWNWAGKLDEHKVDTVLLPVSSPLATVLKESNGWRVVHDDKTSIVFYRVKAQTGVRFAEQDSFEGTREGGQGVTALVHGQPAAMPAKQL